MSGIKKHRRGTKNYYRLLQVPIDILDNANHHQCVGCCFDDLTYRDLPSCEERKRDNLRCQDFISETEVDVYKFIDYIFVPATKQGLADYMKHRLDYS